MPVTYFPRRVNPLYNDPNFCLDYINDRTVRRILGDNFQRFNSQPSDSYSIIIDGVTYYHRNDIKDFLAVLN